MLLGGTKRQNTDAGITQLLASRCAYLIGNSPAERESIEESVREIYDTRSMIVHRGMNGLDADGLRHHDTLINLCKRAIEKELSVLTSV